MLFATFALQLSVKAFTVRFQAPNFLVRLHLVSFGVWVSTRRTRIISTSELANPEPSAVDPKMGSCGGRNGSFRIWGTLI